MIISHAHIHVAADAVAEVIGAFGFEQEYHALQVETGSDGKPRFTHQPFLEVGDSLKPPAACTLLALWLSHAALAFLTSLKLVSALSSALSVSVCVLRSAYLSQSLLSYGACLRVTCAVHLLRHGPDSLRLHIICGQHLILYDMLQNVRVQLDWSALTFGSPWYKLLYAVMPWLAGAKRVRNGIQGVRQVSFVQAHAGLVHCSMDHYRVPVVFALCKAVMAMAVTAAVRVTDQP